MSFVFPDLTPNYFTPLSLPDFKSYNKDWTNGTYTIKRTQFNGVGLGLTLKYEHRSKSEKDAIAAFYNQVKGSKGFTLPSGFFDSLNPDDFILTITSYGFYKWKFAEPFKVNPWIWNQVRSLYNFEVKLVSAMV
ncbi:MAG: hypothetical protein KatS3mg087_0630 [Patescibacteria group bacterium]|nr:MAG: hypothetical protein KatS3mg087_0630 [Patescibacteria group bacterium]